MACKGVKMEPIGVSKRASTIEADDRGDKARGYSGERKDVHTDKNKLAQYKADSGQP